ncbi:G2 and S phase-expressed protein 1 [Rhynchocyon petersi]
MRGGVRSEGLAASSAGPATMDAPKKDDIHLLADEKFDFDLSLSSSSANEDDDVFLGPVGHRGSRGSMEFHHPTPGGPLHPVSASPFRWSPLTGEKLVEVVKEAHLLAWQIEGSSQQQGADTQEPGEPGSPSGEIFVQESKLKVSLFEEGSAMKKSPSALKRETYCLSESPLLCPPTPGQQPPAGPTPHLTLAPASFTHAPEPQPASHPSLAAEPSTTHPPGRVVPQKKATSKLQPPRASVKGKSFPSAVEKLKKETLASPSRMRLLSEESCREALPEKARVPLCAVTASAGGSHLVPGKRSLPVLSKVGLKRTLMRPCGRTGSLAQKNSSSGSLSSMTDSVAASRAGGQVRSGKVSSAAAYGSQSLASTRGQGGPGSTGPMGTARKLAKPADAAKLTVEQSRGPGTALLQQPHTPENASLRLDSTFDLRLDSTFSLPKSSQLDTAGRAGRRDSCLSSRTMVLPSPPDQFKVPQFPVGSAAPLSPGVRLSPEWLLLSRCQYPQPVCLCVVEGHGASPAVRFAATETPCTCDLQPCLSLRGIMAEVGASPITATPQRCQVQRPQSCTSVGRVVHSTPVKVLSGPASQKLLPSARTPMSTKRPPAVPTPASRRLSGLPQMTPRSVQRPQASLRRASALRPSSESRRRSATRNEPPPGSGGKVMPRPSDSSSEGSFSPPAAVPQVLNFSLEKNDFTFSKNLTTEAAPTEVKPAESPSTNEAILVDIPLDQLSITPKTESQPPADLLLIDLRSTPEAGRPQCPPTVAVTGESESKPLIDLMTNTPDMNKDVPLKPFPVVGQLIDLASPLIQLSPAADKENVECPLLEF